jgi:ribosomal protein L37AE/L43A
MNPNNSCPCCSRLMLRHLSSRHSYWYCGNCRIEMPNTDTESIKSRKTDNQNLIQVHTNFIKPKISQSIETVATV